MEWLYGCWRVIKTPRPDQEDLIRLTLQEEDRFVYDETNTGHVDAAESKGPDQEDLDQRYTEKLQEEEGTFALQVLGSRGHEEPRRKTGERNWSIAMKSELDTLAA